MQKREINYLYLTVCIFLAIGMLISSGLWSIIRSYPVLPLLPGISSPGINTTLLLLFTLPLIASIFFLAKRSLLIYISLIALMILVLLDLNRMQPWVYAYALIILSFAINSSDKTSFRADVLLILSLSYIWSGIQKINANYLEAFFPDLVEPILGNGPFVLIAGIGSFLVEITGGFLLLSRRYRKAGIITMIGVHLSILLLIGPLGINTNTVVWPWNLCFILILIQLWSFDEKVSIVQSIKDKKPYKMVLILLLGIMPAFSLMQIWPKYLSSALYSGNKIKTELYISDDFKSDLPGQVQVAVNDTTNVISLLRWSLVELGVPDQPELRIYERVFDDLCKRTDDEFDVILKLYSEPNIITGKREETSYFCGDNYYTD